jgi:hypothetical protein
MPLDIQVIQEPTHLRVEVTGTFDLQDAMARFPLVISACRLTGLTKVLIDSRRMQGDIAATEKAIYSLEVREQYLHHLASGGEPLRVAYLGSAPRVSTYEPGQELAERENLPFLTTTELEDAMLWLGV